MFLIGKLNKLNKEFYFSCLNIRSFLRLYVGEEKKHPKIVVFGKI